MVFNLGVNGYSGYDYRIRVLDEGLELKPDLVVVGYNLNDFPNVIRDVDRKLYAETQGVRERIPKELRDALGRLALFRWVRSQYYALNRDRAYSQAEGIAARVAQEDDSEVWQEQKGYLADIVAGCRAADVEVAVFLFPYESQVVLESYETGPVDRLRAICEELDVPFVDLAQTFRDHVRSTSPRPTLFLRGDRYHPNAKGYELVARAFVTREAGDENRSLYPGSVQLFRPDRSKLRRIFRRHLPTERGTHSVKREAGLLLRQKREKPVREEMHMSVIDRDVSPVSLHGHLVDYACLVGVGKCVTPAASASWVSEATLLTPSFFIMVLR